MSRSFRKLNYTVDINGVTWYDEHGVQVKATSLDPSQLPGYAEGTPRIFEGTDFESDVLEYSGSTREEMRTYIEDAYSCPYTEVAPRVDDYVNSLVGECPTHEHLISLYNHPHYNVIGYWFWLHSSIHTHAFRMGHPTWNVLSGWAKQLKRRPRVLVHGCGSFAIGYTFWAHGFEVVCCDLPVDWILFESYRCAKHGIDIKFLPIYNNYSFLDGQEPFDVVESSCALEHIPGVDEVVSYITKFCNPQAISNWHVIFFTGGLHLNTNEQFSHEDDDTYNVRGNRRWREHLASLGWTQFEVPHKVYPETFFVYVLNCEQEVSLRESFISLSC